MISTVLYFAVFSCIAFFHVSANTDLETLSQIVRNHSNVLIEYPTYVDRTKSVGKEILDFESKLNEYDTYVKDLQKSVIELKNKSDTFTAEIENLEPYERRTDKFEGEVIQLLESAESYFGTLSSLEVYNRRTRSLQIYVNGIVKDVKQSTAEINAVSQNLETYREAQEAQKIIITTEFAKISALEEKHKEISKEFSDIINAAESEGNDTSQNTILDQENYTAIQSELKSKVLEVDTITKIEDALSKKLTAIITQFEEQKENVASNLEALRNNFNSVQNEINIGVQKINPLTKSQEEITKKLNDFSNSLDAAIQTQKTMQTNFNQVSDRIKQFIGSHSSHSY